MQKKIELLAPAGSMACLKAAVSRRADSVYLGMQNFSARAQAVNFNKDYLKEAVRICRSNEVKTYLTMNTLVKNREIEAFFSQLDFAYSAGIDAVILQHGSLANIIRKNYPDLKIHMSTQQGVMNSPHAKLLSNADRITLAREMTKEEIAAVKKSFGKEIEIFCHGALCVSVSGMCLFSSLLGGRSGNRGSCAQPCRRRYNNCYYLSTKDLCLIDKIPEIISIGVDCIKIEGRMRPPYYVASTVEAYRKAIDSHYKGNFTVTKEMKELLSRSFSRGFTTGWFDRSKDMFNRENPSGKKEQLQKEEYKAFAGKVNIAREKVFAKLPEVKGNEAGEKELIVRVYSKEDAKHASEAGADIICLDLYHPDFSAVKKDCKLKVFAVTPRIMLDPDTQVILEEIKNKNPDGIIAGNPGMMGLGLKLPVYLDYNINCLNDYDIKYFSDLGATPILSAELSISNIRELCRKDAVAFAHGKIRLMTLRHELKEGKLTDDRKGIFYVKKIPNGYEILNGKELGLLGKTSAIMASGIRKLYVDTDTEVAAVTGFYRQMLDGRKPDDTDLKADYVLGWSYKGVY